jgi:hypothetical protein
MEISPFSRLARDHARYLSRAVVLEVCLRLAEAVPGHVVEFGVADGSSTRVIRQVSTKDIYALDSFEGLREPFENADIGAFAGPVPDIQGVTIVKGYFEETCTDALREKVGRVAFAHLDADLYSSTLCALRWLTPLLGNGSLILFDEFVGGDKAETRAFADWQYETETPVVRIAEFDREPSGWGEVPDKRALFQVIKKQLTSWTPNQATFLKGEAQLSAGLAASEKVEVRLGDVVVAEYRATEGNHVKLVGVKLNGHPLSKSDWFIYGPHWGKPIAIAPSDSA